MNSVDVPPIKTAAVAGVAVLSSVGDPEGTRTISSIVALLVVLGIGLVMLAVWLFKLTRPDKELLAPLEVMGERKWRRADPVWQRRRLDEVRSPTAQPLQPSAAPPDLDEAFDRGPTASGFDDLHDSAHEPEPGAPDTTPDTTPDEVAIEDVADDADDADDAKAVADDDHARAIGAPQAASGNGEPDEHPALPKPPSPTPLGIERPMDLPERDIDPEIMAAAMAELDAELRLGRDPKPQSSD